MTVVFDSGLPGGKSRMSTGKIEVIFATARSSADDVMKARIQSTRDPGQWTVVSNDHAVIDAARARRMSVLTSAAFASLLRPAQAAPKRKAPRSRMPEKPPTCTSRLTRSKRGSSCSRIENSRLREDRALI